MVTSIRYFVLPTQDDNPECLNFNLRYGGISTARKSVSYTGQVYGDSVFVRPGRYKSSNAKPLVSAPRSAAALANVRVAVQGNNARR